MLYNIKLANFVQKIQQQNYVSADTLEFWQSKLSEKMGLYDFLSLNNFMTRREIDRVLAELDCDENEQLQSQLDAHGYLLLEQTAAGGMGKIYKAYHKQTQQFYALKIVHQENDEHTQELQARFDRECKVVSRLRHMNIVSFVEVLSTTDCKIVVFEWINGCTLAQFIKKYGTIPEWEVAEIALAIINAMIHYHGESIDGSALVHRDLNPKNIVLPASGQAKLIDFGLAKFIDSHDQESIVFGKPVGTVSFNSPEQIMGAEHDEIDILADIYSLGCTLYYCICGREPFTKNYATAREECKSKNRNLNLEDLAISVPFKKLLKQMTAFDKSERIDSLPKLKRHFEKMIKWYKNEKYFLLQRSMYNESWVIEVQETQEQYRISFSTTQQPEDILATQVINGNEKTTILLEKMDESLFQKIEKKSIIFGRQGDISVIIPESEQLTLSMGQRHAYLTIENDTLYLQSMSNPTFINGQEMEKDMQAIGDNAKIQMGSVHFLFVKEKLS